MVFVGVRQVDMLYPFHTDARVDIGPEARFCCTMQEAERWQRERLSISELDNRLQIGGGDIYGSVNVVLWVSEPGVHSLVTVVSTA